MTRIASRVGRFAAPTAPQGIGSRYWVSNRTNDDKWVMYVARISTLRDIVARVSAAISQSTCSSDALILPNSC